MLSRAPQLAAVRFLLEERGAEVNQQDRERGWTPLHRAACLYAHIHTHNHLSRTHMQPCALTAAHCFLPARAHSRVAPYLEIFELLLQHGADASVLSYEGWEDLRCGWFGMPQSAFDVATDAGLGWKPGRLRRVLKALVAKHAAVPKKRVFRCACVLHCILRVCDACADSPSIARFHYLPSLQV
jgi:hypothetical protein